MCKAKLFHSRIKLINIGDTDLILSEFEGFFKSIIQKIQWFLHFHTLIDLVLGGLQQTNKKQDQKAQFSFYYYNTAEHSVLNKVCGH